MEEDIVAAKTYSKLYKIVIREALESMVQQKMYNHLMEIIEGYFLKILIKILIFMTGQKYSQFIVMELNILEAD